MLSDTQLFLSIVFILGVGLFILIGSAAMLGYAAGRQGEDVRPPWWLFGLISAWFGVAIAFSTANLISPGWVLLFSLPPIALGADSLIPTRYPIPDQRDPHPLARLSAKLPDGRRYLYLPLYELRDSNQGVWHTGRHRRRF